MVEGQGGQPLPEIPHLRHTDPLRRHHRRMGTHPGTARKVETPPHELHQPPARDPARHAHHLPARQPRRLSRPRPAAPFRQHHRAQGLHPHQRIAAFLRAARRRVRPRHLVDEVAGQDRRRGLLGAASTTGGASNGGCPTTPSRRRSNRRSRPRSPTSATSRSTWWRSPHRKAATV